MIHPTDRVADVIARDAALIDVFTSVSPVFERLRNPALRRVMARLVTVEQAARIAGVPATDLVARLNGQPSTLETSPTMPTNSAVGTARESAPTEGPVIELDVREELRAGREPFSLIMAARAKVPEGGTLKLRAIFEPVPLYAVLAKQGFDHRTERLADDDWVVWFERRAGSGVPAQPPAAEAARNESPDTCGGCGDGGVVVLDVRGLEPPEPMVRTLAALDTLPADHTLVQVNVKEPRFLLPQLAKRGFTYEVREQGPDLVRVFIRHAKEHDHG